MSIKWSIVVYEEIHNNREETYIVPEELVSHIAISLSYLVIYWILQHVGINCCVFGGLTIYFSIEVKESLKKRSCFFYFFSKPF